MAPLFGVLEKILLEKLLKDTNAADDLIREVTLIGQFWGKTMFEWLQVFTKQ